MKLDDLSRFIERLPFATIDHLRPLTQGHEEVILCQGKTAEQVVAIAERLVAASGASWSRARTRRIAPRSRPGSPEPRWASWVARCTCRPSPSPSRRDGARF